MTAIKRIRESPEFQAVSEEARRQSGEAESVEQALNPVLTLEKTDVEFWCNVLTVVLLFLIWRELSRRGGGI